MEENGTNLFEDDDEHPIPCIACLDIFVVKKGGGAKLIVVIASPLKADERSVQRLMKKLLNYLIFINSEEFTAEAGIPTKENTEVEVKLHPDSDPEIFELLNRCVDWVEDNKASLSVNTLL